MWTEFPSSLLDGFRTADAAQCVAVGIFIFPGMDSFRFHVHPIHFCVGPWLLEGLNHYGVHKAAGAAANLWSGRGIRASQPSDGIKKPKWWGIGSKGHREACQHGDVVEGTLSLTGPLLSRESVPSENHGRLVFFSSPHSVWCFRGFRGVFGCTVLRV